MIRNVKVILAVCILIFLVAPVYAEVQAFKLNDPADFKNGCFVKGSPCDSTFECNITLQYPNDTLFINNRKMTHNTGYYNITLPSSSTKVFYAGEMYCSNTTEAGFETIEFVINPSGIVPSQERTDSLTRTIYFMLFISLMLFATGFMVKNFLPLRVSLFIVGSVVVLIGINLVFVTMQDEIINPGIESLFDTFTAATFYLYWLAALILFVLWFFTVFTNIQAAMERKKTKDLEGVF